MKALFLALGLLVSSSSSVFADDYYYQRPIDYYPVVPVQPSVSFTIPLNNQGASFSFSTNSYYHQPPVYIAPPPVVYRRPYYGVSEHRHWPHAHYGQQRRYYNHGHHRHGHHHDDD